MNGRHVHHWYRRLSRRERLIWAAAVVAVATLGSGAAYALATPTYTDQCVRTVKANGGIVLDCDPIAAGPSPSPSASPSPSPSPTPSPTPTTTNPTPTTTSPAPSPSPTLTGGLLKNCFGDVKDSTGPVDQLRLAACGYPTLANTGVPSSVTLTAYTGPVSPASGAVIDGKLIDCGLTITKPNVVIRNSVIRNPHPELTGQFDQCFYGIDMEGGSLVITDSTVDCVNHEGTGIAYAGYTALRVQAVNCENGFHTSGNNTIVDSYIGGVVEVLGGHGDGIQGTSGSNFVVRHNTFASLNPITSSIIWHGLTMNNVVVADNFFSAGAYTVYVPSGGSNVVYRNNRFYGPVGSWESDPHRPAYGFSDGAGRAGVIWTGNYRDDTLATVAPD